MSDAGDIIALLPKLGTVERRLLARIARRLHLGQQQYGPFATLADDPRDFRREAMEEALDGFVYSARALVADEMREEADGGAK